MINNTNKNEKPATELVTTPKGEHKLSVSGQGRSTIPSESSLKRYNLALPTELFDAIQAIANKRHTTVLEVIKRFIKLGLLAEQIADDPSASLIVREGAQEREIVLL